MPKRQQLNKYRAAMLVLFCLLAGAALLIPQFNRQPAPDVTFQTIAGQRIKLSELLGKPVIVTFWATDCPGCIKEIPHLIELYQHYHPKGLEIIAVAMYYDPPNHVVAMSKARQLPYDVALDMKAELALAFGSIRLTPTTVLISPDGTIVLNQTGMFDLQDMKTRIENMLEG